MHGHLPYQRIPHHRVTGSEGVQMTVVADAASSVCITNVEQDDLCMVLCSVFECYSQREKVYTRECAP